MFLADNKHYSTNVFRFRQGLFLAVSVSENRGITVLFRETVHHWRLGRRDGRKRRIYAVSM